MNARGRIRWTMIGCVALLALIAGTVSYLVGLENTIVEVTCFFSQQRGAVTRRSGTRV